MKTTWSFLPLVFALVLRVGTASPVLAVEDAIESDLQIYIESDSGVGVSAGSANDSWVGAEPKPLDIGVPEFFRWAGSW